MKRVSVLFSEPKIPQLSMNWTGRWDTSRFSALQRAENSSIVTDYTEAVALVEVSVLFSEPKIPQSIRERRCGWRASSFSALQRAENSSICSPRRVHLTLAGFSALQRAENSSICGAEGEGEVRDGGFSALQRAENSSIIFSRLYC